ncbi:MAG: hypothetical protein LUE12_09625 [Ruminococcus sp.]|nr:hypothetical protein [Ruminococcus sp.]
MVGCEENENIQVGIEYLSRPSYSSAEEYVSAMAAIVESNGYSCQTATVTGADETVGYYFYADFGDNAFSINCIFPINETEYINVWYGFTDEAYFEEVITSLESFSWS